MARWVAALRPPDVLVIGAMKCGTTTLFHDLAAHGSVGLIEKESFGLESLGEPVGRRANAYLRQWGGLSSLPVIGEVNTTYAMAPHFPGVPERAAQLAPRAKILYIVREPIARIISHHHHDVANGVVKLPIDTAVHADSRFLDYSRYGMQIALWREHFADESIRVVRFEDYVNDRRAQANAIVGWLGLESYPAGVALEQAHNDSRERRSARGLLRRALHSPLYQQHLHSLVPTWFRRAGSSLLLPPVIPRPASPKLETVRWLVDALSGDVAELAGFTGGKVTWDLEEVVRSHEPTDARP